MKSHKLASLFPTIEGNEFRSLVEDIKANGLREPIIRFQGQILDGRNRFQACTKANVTPDFEDFEGTEDEALKLVISKNLLRRHLSERQRAVAAARVVETKHGGDRKSEDRVANRQLDREAAAGLFGVKLRSLDRAAVVVAKGVPELVAAVDAGRVAVSKAAQVAKRSTQDQCGWLADPVKQEAKWRKAEEADADEDEPEDKKTFAEKVREAKEEAKLDAHTAKTAFLLRATEVARVAVLTCKPDQDVLQIARAAAEAWAKLAHTIEEKLT